jgi:hypothetical protein
MVVGMSGQASATVPIQDAAEAFASVDALIPELPRLWKAQPPPAVHCQIVVVGWSPSRERIVGFEIYAAPGAEPTFEEVLIGTKLDDDLDPAGLHYREIRKLAGFCEPDPTIAYAELLHRLCAANILDASKRGHYGRPFAGGPVDFATVSRDGVQVQQLNVGLADAA